MQDSNRSTEWTGVELAGRYVVRGILGEGGMGRVFHATDRRLATDVVIKAPHAALLEQEEFSQRFAREIRSLVQLSHPHIVKITDVGSHDGMPFAVMQYLGGGSLEDRRRGADGGKAEPMTTDSLSDWLPKTAEALDFIHGRDYVHRDIKPGNILFDKDGNVYLSDFGVAKIVSESEAARQTSGLTGTGMVLGTVDYMAPEVMTGNDYDGKADQYSLAVTAYELLSGHRPFSGPTPAAVMISKVTERAVPLSSVAKHVPNEISEHIERALAKEPASRFGSCSEFSEAISRSAVAVAIPELTPVVGPADPPQPSTQDQSQQQSSPQPSSTERRPNQCPECGASLNLKPQHAGKQAPCPKCRAALQIASDLSGVHAVAAAEAEAKSSQSQAQVDTDSQAIQVETNRNPVAPKPNPLAGVGKSFIGMVGQNKVLSGVITVGTAVAATVIMLVISAMHDDDTGTRGTSAVSANAEATDTSSVIDGGGSSSRSDDRDSSRGSDDRTRNPVAGRTAGEIRVFTGQNIEFCWCPPGTFAMGSPESDVVALSAEKPQVEVTHTEGFWLSRTEVTQQLWKDVMKTEPWDGMSNIQEGTDYPAIYISWNDAQDFCEELTRREHAAGRLPEGMIYALPTEAQWEYACRADTTTTYSFGDDVSFMDHCAWYDENAFNADAKFAHRVRQKTPNGWQLYDMHGNAAEWCRDWYSENYYSTLEVSARDPRGPVAGLNRTYRGGSWFNSSEHCRSASRVGTHPTYQLVMLGMRVALVSLSTMPGTSIAGLDDDNQPEETVDVDILMAQANQLRNQEEFDEAAAIYKQVTDADPDNLSAWSLRGYCLHTANKINDAIPVHEKALQLARQANPPNRGIMGLSLFNLGCAYALKDDREKALDYLSQAADTGWTTQNVMSDPDLILLHDHADFEEIAARLLGQPAGNRGGATNTAANEEPEPFVPKIQSFSAQRIEFCWCPPGTFLMGSPDNDGNARDNEKPQIEVEMPQGFWLSRTEVTQRQWNAIAEVVPWNQQRSVQQDGSCPATFISWELATAYCERLTEFEHAAGRLPANMVYTLPTEAQWEYACRAGSTTRYGYGDSEASLRNYAWYDANAADADEEFAHQVAQKRANPWGLYDMHGNVWEWCLDRWSEDITDAANSSTGATASRVIRGGSWNLAAEFCRSAKRNRIAKDRRTSEIGFRVAIVPAPAAD